METRNIAQKKPVVMETNAGKYWWCQCGLSKNQPFCDGSHKTTSFTPIEVTIDQSRNIAWCACKQTGNAPFCDGSHKKL